MARNRRLPKVKAQTPVPFFPRETLTKWGKCSHGDCDISRHWEISPIRPLARLTLGSPLSSSSSICLPLAVFCGANLCGNSVVSDDPFRHEPASTSERSGLLPTRMAESSLKGKLRSWALVKSCCARFWCDRQRRERVRHQYAEELQVVAK